MKKYKKITANDLVLSRNYFFRLTRNIAFPLEFKGTSKADWEQWRKRCLFQIRRLMAPFPESVKLEIKTLETASFSDYIRYKIIYRSEKYCWVPAWILVPTDITKGEKRPAILCLHGHGKFGKDSVVGIEDTRERRKEIIKYNYDYGRKLARLGYIVIAPDLRSFGERVNYCPRPENSDRDCCESHGNCAALFGYNLLTMNVWDAKCAIDVLTTLKEVDVNRIGCVGLSYGARVTSFICALDERIKAAVVSGAMNTFVDRININLGSCGSQIVHGLLQHGDMPEVIGLTAPRALFFEKGNNDPEPSYKEYYRRVFRVYKAAKAANKLWLRVFKGGHVFEGKQSFEWLHKWL